MERDEFLQKRVRELSRLAYDRGIAMFTDFLNLNELYMINSLGYRETGIAVETFGGYEFAERQMAAFLPDALSYSWKYPLACMKASVKSIKFKEELTHRDYLGALLHLGIDRCAIGDILVDEEGAYIFCTEKIKPFLLENLTKVRHTLVLCSEANAAEELPAPTLEPVRGTVSSVRLDSVAALGFQMSRSSMAPLISQGLVFVNGKLITSNGYTLKDGDIISVRHKGRLRYDGITGQSKKGRYAIELYRYV